MVGLRIYYRLNDVSKEEEENEEEEEKRKEKRIQIQRVKIDVNAIFRVQLESQKHFTQKNC